MTRVASLTELFLLPNQPIRLTLYSRCSIEQNMLCFDSAGARLLLFCILTLCHMFLSQEGFPYVIHEQHRSMVWFLFTGWRCCRHVRNKRSKRWRHWSKLWRVAWLVSSVQHAIHDARKLCLLTRRSVRLCLRRKQWQNKPGSKRRWHICIKLETLRWLPIKVNWYPQHSYFPFPVSFLIVCIIVGGSCYSEKVGPRCCHVKLCYYAVKNSNGNGSFLTGRLIPDSMRERKMLRLHEGPLITTMDWCGLHIQKSE